MSELRFPDFNISVDWKEEIPYNIFIYTKNLKVTIKIEKLEIKFENGENTDF
ncbi:MAG: hypothetical protein ABDH37_00385 [Candidatus Hydrothermales bacterium]